MWISVWQEDGKVEFRDSWLSYQGHAGHVFHDICLRRYQRTAHDFRGSVFRLVKVGLIIPKSFEYDSLRWKVNSFVTSIHTLWVLESTAFL